MRIFIAVDIDDEVVRDLADKVQKVIKSLGTRATYPDPTSLHITLKFIGEVDRSRLEEIYNRLEGVSAKPFKIYVGGVGAFPRLDRPRVLFLDVSDPSGGLTRLHKEIDTRLKGLVTPESRPFKPHVTVARIKQYVFLTPRVIESFPNVGDIELEVKSFRVKESILTPQGPIYKTLKEYPLEGG